MNEAQEAVLARAYQSFVHDPHIQYGTQWDRFGVHVPPSPLHMDCTGAVHTWYWEGFRLSCGLDTGDMWRDVARGLCRVVRPADARPGAILLHRQGSIYNGGSDEHGALKVRNEGDRIRTYESAGSRKGLTYESRPASWWTDGLEYFAMFDGSATAPPPLPPKEQEMYRLLKGDVYDDVWFTNWIQKRHVGGHPGHDKAAQDEAAAILASGATDGKKTIIWPQAWVDAIAEVR